MGLGEGPNKHERTFWSDGNILCLDYSGDYMVYTLFKIHSKCIKSGIMLVFNE